MRRPPRKENARDNRLARVAGRAKALGHSRGASTAPIPAKASDLPLPMASRAPLLSVIVCTWNSGDRARETLVSLAHQSLPRDRYEVIVIDNASDDGTAERLARWSGPLGFRIAREEKLGLCHARNRGVAEARGRYLLFMDDDAVAPAHLLETYARAARRHRPELMGGPAHGLWESEPPRWLQTFHWRGFSLFSYGARQRWVRGNEFFLGCNVVFRRDVFDRFGLFDPELDRKGAGLAGDGERLLELKVLHNGGRGLYLPEAYVFHKVTRARMTKDYFLRRAEQNTTVKVRLGEKAAPGLLGTPVLLVRQLGFAVIRTLKQAAVTLALELQLIAADWRGRRAAKDKSK